MDIRDPVDAKAVEMYSADAGVVDLDQAAALLAASDVQVRDHYRGIVVATNTPPVERSFLHVDAHFRMGTGHEAEGTPCQDYATSGFMGDGSPFAIVSDGCSTSGRTDVGARIAALAAARAMRSIEESDDVNPASLVLFLQGAFEDAMRSLGLLDADLDATLCVVSALRGGGARALVFGDGVVAARVPGGLDVRVVEWAGNMPGYPNYLMGQFRGDRTRQQAFVSQSEAFAAEAGTACCVVKRYLLPDAGPPELVTELGFDASVALEGIVFEWTPEEGADAISVMSDGVCQFSGADWNEVVDVMTSYKAAREGEFVRRRMGRCMATLGKAGARPIDDVAVAAIAKGSIA